jgi:hypothetical protein
MGFAASAVRLEGTVFGLGFAAAVVLLLLAGTEAVEVLLPVEAGAASTAGAV